VMPGSEESHRIEIPRKDIDIESNDFCVEKGLKLPQFWPAKIIFFGFQIYFIFLPQFVFD
jgi:hypothetical protein